MLMSLSSLVIRYTYPLEGFDCMEGFMIVGKSEDISRLLSIMCLSINLSIERFIIFWVTTKVHLCGARVGDCR